MEYYVIEAHNKHDLESSVKHYLQLGWVVIGGVNVVSVRMHKSSITFYQTMIKYPLKKKKVFRLKKFIENWWKQTTVQDGEEG